MITIKEVAKEAGVSITTVSRVMNNRGYISAETRGKVEGAMKKLNYQPNQLARSFHSKKTFYIGLLIPDVTIPFCILVNDMDQMARLAEYHAAVVFTLNHIRLFARIAVYFQRQLLAKLVLPLFFLTVITEVTSCAIRIDVFIIIRTPDRLFFSIV